MLLGGFSPLVKQNNCVTWGVPERAEGMMSAHRFWKHDSVFISITVPIDPSSPNSNFCKIRISIHVLLPTPLGCSEDLIIEWTRLCLQTVKRPRCKLSLSSTSRSPAPLGLAPFHVSSFMKQKLALLLTFMLTHWHGPGLQNVLCPHLRTKFLTLSLKHALSHHPVTWSGQVSWWTGWQRAFGSQTRVLIFLILGYPWESCWSFFHVGYLALLLCPMSPSSVFFKNENHQWEKCLQFHGYLLSPSLASPYSDRYCSSISGTSNLLWGWC